MNRRIDWHLVGLVALISVLVGFTVFYFAVVSPANQQRCRDDGGRVLEVRDGKGWICVEGGR